MNWSEPRLIWIFLFIPFFICVLVWGQVQIRKRLESLFAIGRRPNTQKIFMKRKFVVAKAVLFAAAFSLLCISIIGPRWGWHWIESKQKGLDIMVAIDVSRSMDAKDVDPSRIEQARRLVRDLLDVAEGDRIGLIAFAGVSFVQCPLTSDREAIRMFLDVINTELIPAQGTDLSGAISTATKSLTAGGGEGVGKILLVLSDGEDHLSAKAGGLGTATEAAKAAGIRIFSVGMGTTGGGPIPTPNGSFKSDQSGNLVISRLEEDALKAIAKDTEGFYARGGTSDGQIDRIYKSGMHRVGTELETRSQRERVWFERYQWFAAAALILLLIEGLLKEYVSLLVGFLLIIFTVSSHQARAGDFYDKYNEAVGQSQNGDQKSALKSFEEVAESATDPRLKQRAASNSGVLKANAGDFEGAKKSFESALSLDPQDQQTRENMQWVQAQLQKKKDEEQKQQKDQNKNKDKNNKQDKKEDGQGDKQQDQQKGDGKDQKQENNRQPENKDKSDNSKNPEQENKSKDADKKDSESDPKKSEKQQDGKDANSENPKQAQNAKEMSKQDAERLLRMIPDDFGKFYRPPESMQKPKEQSQDW